MDNSIGKQNILYERDLLRNLLLDCGITEQCDKLATDLLCRFSNLNAILDSDFQSLLQIESMTENAAIYLSLASEITRRIGNEENNKGSVFSLADIDDRIFYCKTALSDKSSETLLFICIDKFKCVTKQYITTDGIVDTASLSLKKALKNVVNYKPYGVIIAHNHPEGYSDPSINDINFTLNVGNWLNAFDIKLIDHIIVGENDAFSFLIEGYEYLFDQ